MVVLVGSALTCGMQVRACAARGSVGARSNVERLQGVARLGPSDVRRARRRGVVTTRMQHEQIYAHSPLQPRTVVGKHAVRQALRLQREMSKPGDGQTALRRLLEPHVDKHIPWCGHYIAVQQVSCAPLDRLLRPVC